MARLLIAIVAFFTTLGAIAQPYRGKRMVAAKVADSYIIYNVENNGGIVIATDDDQVVGYTDKGDLQLALQNPVFKAVLDNLACVQRERRKAARTSHASDKRKALLASANAQPLKAKVDPLLTDLWHQYYEPYNLLAPMADSTAHCVSGCVASAMAQVMHFWRHPEHGYGSYTYVDSLGCGQTLTVDFQNHYYDWDNMLNDYEGVKYSDAQAYSVAQLMYDCGVSVDMKYGKDASGASSVKQPRALSTHFGYDCSAQMHFRDFYTLDEWTTMFKTELSAGRPILVSGYNYRLGHAFVCDGYDERDFFHFSFGNPNGAGDGFFYLPYLTPDFRPSQNPDEPESGFNLLQSIVTHLVPNTSPEATGVENHLFALSGMELIGKDSVVVNRLGNVGWNLHNDSVAVALTRDGQIAHLLHVYQRQFMLEEIEDTTYTDTLLFSLPKTVSDGTYKIVPMYKDNGEWIEARASLGVPNYLIANVKGKEYELSVDSANTSYLTLEDFSFPDWLPTSSTPDFSVTLKNHNADFCGRFYVLLVNEVDSLPSFLMQEQGLTLSADEVTTRRFYHTPRNGILPGEYGLYVFYDHDLFSAELETVSEEPLKKVIVSEQRPDAIIAPGDENMPTGGVGKNAAFSIGGVKIADDNQASGIYIKDKKKFISR